MFGPTWRQRQTSARSQSIQYLALRQSRTADEKMCRQLPTISQQCDHYPKSFGSRLHRSQLQTRDLLSAHLTTYSSSLDRRTIPGRQKC